MSSAFLNKRFQDVCDKYRMLEPIKEDGPNFICKVYMREEKKLRMKERRPKEDGREGTELVVYWKDVDTTFYYIGSAVLGKNLFRVAERIDPRSKNRDFKREQLQRIGYRLI